MNPPPAAPVSDDLRTVFRPSVGARALYVTSFLLVAGLGIPNLLGVWNAGESGGPTLRVLGWAFVAGDGVIVWRAAFVQRVAFDASELIVVNVIRRYRIPFSAIVVGSCSTGRFGTRVGYRRAGQSSIRYAIAAAAPTSPADRAFAKRHAEDLVHLIESAAEAARGNR